MFNDDGLNSKVSKNLSYLEITYSCPTQSIEPLTLRYRLRHHNFLPKWIEVLTAAKKNYSIDDPGRFINSYKKIIKRKITKIDQDTLNYLHHIFALYHGLLDQQNHKFFVDAPDLVKKSLANLNILVHKFESISRGVKPRHVVTYFGLPKTKKLSIEDYDLFTDRYQFGTVYLNYVEIGKSIEDLAIDQDHYISDEAFKPFRFYSADFCVLFYNSDENFVKEKRSLIKNFYDNNKSFFLDRNLPFEHPYLRPGKIPLADLDSHGQEVVQLITQRQFVKTINLI